MIGASVRARQLGRNPLFSPPPVYTTPGIGDGLGIGSEETSPPGMSMPVTGLGMFGRNGANAVRRPSTLSLDIGDIYGQASREADPVVPSDTAVPQLSGSVPLDLPAPDIAPVHPDFKVPKPGFFAKDGAWRDVLGGLADAMATAGGGQPTYFPLKIQRQRQQAEWDRQDATRRQDRQWQIEDRDYKANLPQYFMSGHDRVKFDPTTGQSQTVFDAPPEFQEYADLLGLEPGSDEYNDAMQDYVLRSNGPTAQAGRVNLEGVRQGNRVGLEDVRQRNRLSLRQSPTYANTHPRPAAAGGAGGGSGGNGPPRNTGAVYAPILAKLAKGIPLTPGEQQVLDMRGRGGRTPAAGAGGAAPAQTATDPRTGKKVKWNGSAWVPAN